MKRIDADRRGDLRAASLYVIDIERQRRGFDPSIAGACETADVTRIFDECLETFPLDQEVGESLSGVNEIPVWTEVLARMEPIWQLWPRYWMKPEALRATSAWRSLQGAVSLVVRQCRLWDEEIAFPVAVERAGGERSKVRSLAELCSLSAAQLRGTGLTDAAGRAITVRDDGAGSSVDYVSLPSNGSDSQL